jgi:hypothetical protein
MAEYLVEWKIDIDAENPLDAAKQARRIHLEPGSTATVFQVTDTKTNESKDADEVVTKETCWNCGSSVAWRSGRFVNRIPSLDSEEVRKIMAQNTQKAGTCVSSARRGSRRKHNGRLVWLIKKQLLQSKGC